MSEAWCGLRGGRGPFVWGLAERMLRTARCGGCSRRNGMRMPRLSIGGFSRGLFRCVSIFFFWGGGAGWLWVINGAFFFWIGGCGLLARHNRMALLTKTKRNEVDGWMDGWIPILLIIYVLIYALLE